MSRWLSLLAVVTLALPAGAFDDVVTSPPDDGARGELRLFAQRAEGERRGGHGRRERLSPEQRKALEEEVQRKMQTYLTVELSSRLGLDDKTALKLADAVRAHTERQRSARKALRAEHEALEQLLTAKAGAEKLKQQTARVLAAHESRPDLAELAKETEKFLSAEQQARLVLALPQVTREMGRMMKKARRGAMRGGHGGGHGGGAP